MSGRFAPSPTGDLHLGNLRTALLAWSAARHDGVGFLVRMEDLDRATSSRIHEHNQLADLAMLGLDWDAEVVRQSERFDLHLDALARLEGDGLTYPCYCTRREIADAARAPHSAEGRYPGTCRHLTSRQRAERMADGRPPAIRLRAPADPAAAVTFDDRVVGHVEGVVDDIVLRRNDGVPAYHLAVVVDDHLQGVTQVLRGDDLLPATASQIHLARLIGAVVPTYAHVPLLLGPTGARLAKRDGAVTLGERTAALGSVSAVVAELAGSAGLDAGDPPTAAGVAAAFSFDALDRRPARWTPRSDGAWTLSPDSRGTG